MKPWLKFATNSKKTNHRHCQFLADFLYVCIFTPRLCSWCFKAACSHQHQYNQWPIQGGLHMFCMPQLLRPFTRRPRDRRWVGGKGLAFICGWAFFCHWPPRSMMRSSLVAKVNTWLVLHSKATKRRGIAFGRPLWLYAQYMVFTTCLGALGGFYLQRKIEAKSTQLINITSDNTLLLSRALGTWGRCSLHTSTKKNSKLCFCCLLPFYWACRLAQPWVDRSCCTTPPPGRLPMTPGTKHMGKARQAKVSQDKADNKEINSKSIDWTNRLDLTLFTTSQRKASKPHE